MNSASGCLHIQSSENKADVLIWIRRRHERKKKKKKVRLYHATKNVTSNINFFIYFNILNLVQSRCGFGNPIFCTVTLFKIDLFFPPTLSKCIFAISISQTTQVFSDIQAPLVISATPNEVPK